MNAEMQVVAEKVFEKKAVACKENFDHLFEFTRTNAENIATLTSNMERVADAFNRVFIGNGTPSLTTQVSTLQTEMKDMMDYKRRVDKLLWGTVVALFAVLMKDFDFSFLLGK